MFGAVCSVLDQVYKNVDVFLGQMNQSLPVDVLTEPAAAPPVISGAPPGLLQC